MVMKYNIEKQYVVIPARYAILLEHDNRTVVGVIPDIDRRKDK